MNMNDKIINDIENVFEDQEETIKEYTEKEDIKEDIKTITIKTATPFNATVLEASFTNKTIGTIYFICKDNDDKLFILMANYILESEEQINYFYSLPFYKDYEFEFVSTKIVNNFLVNCLDSYVSDLDFTIDNLNDIHSIPDVYISANKVSTKEKVNLKMNPEIFSCIAFINSYIYDRIDNIHDLTLATVAGSKSNDNYFVEFFVVDKINSVISMAPAEVSVKRKGLSKIFGLKKNKYETTVGIVFKVSRFINNTDREVAHILAPFNVGTTFDNSKFRGNTIEKIQSKYYGDSDQYVGTLIINNIRIYGVDKEYMIIRGKRKDKVVKIFLLDSAAQKELNFLIDSY